MAHVSKEAVLKALSTVNDPDLKRPLTELGMIDKLNICEGHVAFDLKLTTTACPLKEQMRNDAIAAVKQVPGVENVTVEISKDTVTLQAKIKEREAVPGIKNMIAVSSGKGGVGKSTVAVNLACSMAQQGAKVGILDADIYGPNVPLMMGLKDKTLKETNAEGKLIPPENYGIKVMSMAFLVKEDQPIVWRGPLLDKVIRQFLNDTAWGELDYLIIDLPPGTGDAQLTIVQATPVVGAVIVTTPQDVALLDSRRGLAMFTNANIPVIGIVENMSYHVCSHCNERDDIFGHDGGRLAAEALAVPFLGAVPLVSKVREQADKGCPVVMDETASEASDQLKAISNQIIAKVCELSIQSIEPEPESEPEAEVVPV